MRSAPDISGSTWQLLKHVFFPTVAPVTRPISCEAPQPTGQGCAQVLSQSACLSWAATLIRKMGITTTTSDSFREVILAKSGQGGLSKQCKAQAAFRKISVSPLEGEMLWGVEQGESDPCRPPAASPKPHQTLALRAPPGSFLNNQARRALSPVLPRPPKAPRLQTPFCFPSLHS